MKFGVIIVLIFVFGVNCIASLPDHVHEKTLFEALTKTTKKTKALNLYLNTHASFNAYFNNDELNEAAFRLDQFRIEATGDINDWIYYRWRQALNVSNQAQSLDNTPSSIDYAAVGFRLSPKFSLFAGKQGIAFGGYEFDANPIEVYEYSTLINYMVCFLTGVDVCYNLTDNQEFHFQVVNTRNGSMQEMFGKLPQGVEKSKLPLGYTINWNGNFNETIKTRWSVSLFNDARKKFMYYYALGTELNVSKFNMYFDFMYADEALDREGIVSRLVYDAGYEERAMDTKYLSLVTRLNYRFRPKWNVFVKGMYETAGVTANNGVLTKGKYQTSFGYLGGVEFYPMERNLHFYVTYVGRSYDYTDRAKLLGVRDYSTQRLSLGFIYKIPVF